MTLFSACHTHHNQCTYTRACTPMQTVQQQLCDEIIANYSRFLETLFRSTANIFFWKTPWKRDDALAESNIQRRACWFNTPDCRAIPTPHFRSNFLCLLNVLLRSAQNPIIFHAARERIAAALSNKHYPIAKKWGDTEIAERGRSVLVMRARYRSAGLTPH